MKARPAHAETAVEGSAEERRQGQRRQNERRSNVSGRQSIPAVALNTGFILAMQFLLIVIFCN
ncbi:hypothetical protein KKI24_30780 [bacterium]|nr:hypothetical protein [bacterium]